MCESSGRVITGILTPATPVNAQGTLTATVEGDRRRHLHARRIGSSLQSLTAVPAPYRTLTWRLIDTNEGRTLVATIHEYFHEVSSSMPAEGCFLERWSVDDFVISHDRKWSNPPVWP